MLPTKFQVNWPFSSGKGAKNRFSRWWPSWISHQNDFSYFWSTSYPHASYQVSSQMPFWFRRWSKKFGFQDGCHGSHLGFLIRMTLAMFDLQVTLMLPTKFQVNWAFGSGEEAKNRFLISEWNDFSYFWSTPVTPMLPTKFRVNWLLVQERKNRFSWWLSSWISNPNDFSYFRSTSHPDAYYHVNWPLGSGEEAKNRLRPSWISDRNGFSYCWFTSHPNVSYQVSSQLAQGCRRSRLSKQLLRPHQMNDWYWLIKQLTLSTSCSGELKTYVVDTH